MVKVEENTIMSTNEPLATAPVRHPYGLPAGSVRALLVLEILVPFWLVLAFPQEQTLNPNPMPLFLYFLLGLVLVFYAAHGNSIATMGSAQASPWHLPRGFFRVGILALTVIVAGYRLYTQRERTLELLTPTANQLAQWPELLLALSAGFGLGWLLRLGPWRRSPWFQDVQASISLVAMLGLAVEAILHLFISPTLGQALDLPLWEAILTGIVAFYFGVRS